MDLDVIIPGRRYMVCGGVGGTPEGRWLEHPGAVGIVEVTSVGRQPGATVRSVTGTVAQVLAPPAARSATLCMQDLGATVVLRGNHLLAQETDYRQIWSVQQATLRVYTQHAPQLRKLGQQMARVVEAALNRPVCERVPALPDTPSDLGVIALEVFADPEDREWYPAAYHLTANFMGLPAVTQYAPSDLRRAGWRWRRDGEDTWWKVPVAYVAALQKQLPAAG